MGQQPNKYHISDDGKVYRINEDGSFTSVGNIEDIENKQSSTTVDKMPPPVPTLSIEASNALEVSWWMRNYNWLWVTTLVVFIVWFILCLSFARYEVDCVDVDGSYSHSYVDNTGEFLIFCANILFCLCLSWYLSTRDNKTILKLAQIFLVGSAGWSGWCCLFYLSNFYYSFFMVCLAFMLFSIWLITICLSLFTRY